MVTPKIFNKVTLDANTSTASAGNYPRSYELYVSDDGTNWGTALATGNGTGQFISIGFATQTKRYIKVRPARGRGRHEHLVHWRARGVSRGFFSV
jgi:hypothetical protein